MKRIADQGDRDLEHRLQLREETRLAQERADDAATMAVDPSKYPAPIRAYWEKKQAMVIEREEQAYNVGSHQPLASSEGEDDSVY